MRSSCWRTSIAAIRWASRRVTAAVRGTQEVLGAVVASTLTNMAVFLPVLFVQEEAGQLFRDIALAITRRRCCPSWWPMTVIPAATARLFREHGKLNFEPRRCREPRMRIVGGANDHGNGHDTNGACVASTIRRTVGTTAESPLEAARDGSGGRAAQRVRRRLFGDGGRASIAGRMRSTPRRLAVVFAMVGVSAVLTLALLAQGRVSADRQSQSGDWHSCLPPPGYNLDELMKMGEQVEANCARIGTSIRTARKRRSSTIPVIGDFFFVARGRQVFIGVRAYDPIAAAELVPLLRNVALTDQPGTIVMAKQTSLFEQGLQGGRKVDVEITGPELTKLVQHWRSSDGPGDAIDSERAAVPEAEPRPVQSRKLHVEPKLVQAADMQVSSADLGFAVNALVDGAYAGDYYLDGKKIDLTVLGEDRFAKSHAGHRGTADRHAARAARAARGVGRR